VLAAVERAQLGSGRGDPVALIEIAEHLGFVMGAYTTRQLRPVLIKLVEAGALQLSRWLSREHWELISAGRRRLARARGRRCSRRWALLQKPMRRVQLGGASAQGVAQSASASPMRQRMLGPNSSAKPLGAISFQLGGSSPPASGSGAISSMSPPESPSASAPVLASICASSPKRPGSRSGSAGRQLASCVLRRQRPPRVSWTSTWSTSGWAICALWIVPRSRAQQAGGRCLHCERSALAAALAEMLLVLLVICHAVDDRERANAANDFERLAQAASPLSMRRGAPETYRCSASVTAPPSSERSDGLVVVASGRAEKRQTLVLRASRLHVRFH
jgi:hypothetical protein